jgi:hypothetical protein
MKKFRVIYKDCLNYTKEVIIKAGCPEMAEVIFSNKYGYTKILEVKEV